MEGKSFLSFLPFLLLCLVPVSCDLLIHCLQNLYLSFCVYYPHSRNPRLRSIVYILVLLLLVFYLFAIVGIYAFRDNDPFHFGDIFVAHLTLFRCSTLEDWTDVMYINMYGCDPEGPKDWGPGYMYDSGIYTTDPAKANPNGLPVLCDKPNPQMFASFLYFFIFTCVSALVMLSLFIGAVTMSMTESMEEMKNLAKEEERKEQLLKAREKAERERLAAE